MDRAAPQAGRAPQAATDSPATTPSPNAPLGLFAGYGVELEYMIVDAESLDVRPLADRLLAAAAGHLTGEYEAGDAAWSNELVAHLIEIKTNGPVARMADVPQLVQR